MAVNATVVPQTPIAASLLSSAPTSGLPSGAVYIKGDKGDKGDRGDPGPIGPAGPQGERGLQGPPGVQGEKGDKGDKGDTGSTGPSGPSGPSGPQGPKGDTGDTGPRGLTGETGPQGPKGDTGETGPQGPAGRDGVGIPAGGTQYQLLQKASGTDYDVEWATVESGGLTILSYGNSTWADFIDVYAKNKVVYCRASSNSNPASGSQTRLAFMAYVNNATNPTEVEFQYYRSVSSHSDSQQGDQVFVYKLNKNTGWSVTTRNAFTKIVAGTGLSSSYSSGALTLTNGVTPATAGPFMDGTAAVGVSDKYAREDHVHPSDTGREEQIKKFSITLTAANWSGNDPYTQTVSVSGGTATSKVDLQPTAAQIAALVNDGVAALLIENNSGTFTAYAVGAAPSTDMTIQATRTEVTT